MTYQFRATKTRPDGTEVLEVSTPAKFTLDWASRSLAVVYAREPMRTGYAALIDGLRDAERNGTADRARAGELVDVAEAAVQAYRTRLTTPPQVPFPQGKLRERMLAERQAHYDKFHASGGYGTTENRRQPGRPAGHPATWAHEYDEEIGDWVLTIDVPRWYDLYQTALALALVHDDSVVPKHKKDVVPRDRVLLRKRFRAACDQNLLGNSDGRDVLVDTAGRELVDAYRATLLNQRVFSTVPTS